MSEMSETNTYGQPIVDAALFDGPHVVNPGPAGELPVCSCGWTPWAEFTMADHLEDMGRFVQGVAATLEP